MITLDQLVPSNHLDMETAIDFPFMYDLVNDMYSEVGRPSINPVMSLFHQLKLSRNKLR